MSPKVVIPPPFFRSADAAMSGEMERLADLRARDALSEDEYVQAKGRLLSGGR